MFFGDQTETSSFVEDPYLKEKARREKINAAVRGDNPENLLKLFKDKMKTRGVRGMVGLQRLFKVMDDDQSGSLSLPEFVKVCRDFKVGINDDYVPFLFAKFDKNNDGTLSYDEFISAIRDPLSQSRRELVEQVFNKIDKN